MFNVSFFPDDDAAPTTHECDSPKTTADAVRNVLVGKLAVYSISEDEVDTSDAWEHLLHITRGDVVGPIASLQPGQHLALECEDGRLRVECVASPAGHGSPVLWHYEDPNS